MYMVIGSVQIANLEEFSPESMLHASNDIAAINSWLRASTKNSKHTFDSYAREARRFVIYLNSINIGLKQVKGEDIDNYLNILQYPPAHWLIPDDQQITTSTQCMSAALSESSVNHARTVIKGLFSYLNDAGYLKGNPVALTARIKSEQESMAEKALVVPAWNTFWKWVVQKTEAATEKDKALWMRNRFMCAVLYHTGMRLSSLVAARMNSFYRKNIGSELIWHLAFPMKGKRLHTVIATNSLMDELVSYRKYLGLQDFPAPAEDTPLIMAYRKKAPISPRGVEYAISEMVEQAASDCNDPFIADEIRKITPHTFRHTHATHRLLAGASLLSTQKTLGHKSITTTTIYAAVVDEMLLNESDMFGEFSEQQKIGN